MEDVKIPSFQELFENTIIKQVIENKITEEIAIATAEKDKQIADLQTQVDELTATILMGGNANV